MHPCCIQLKLVLYSDCKKHTNTNSILAIHNSITSFVKGLWRTPALLCFVLKVCSTKKFNACHHIDFITLSITAEFFCAEPTYTSASLLQEEMKTINVGVHHLPTCSELSGECTLRYSEKRHFLWHQYIILATAVKFVTLGFYSFCGIKLIHWSENTPSSTFKNCLYNVTD